ncbi:MAG: hypothetical protein ABIQ95_14850, partial [Bdellovibrionia bacterium]
VTDFDCVFVNIMGYGIGDWAGNKANIEANPGCGYIGAISDFVDFKIGGTATVEVPFGLARIVQVLGVRSTTGCTTKMDTSIAPSVITYSGIFEMGRTVTDILADKEITVNNAYSISTARDFRCLLGNPPEGVDTVAPVIGGVITSVVSANSTQLSWPAANDNGASAANLEYKVVRGTALTDINTVAKAEIATFVSDWTAWRGTLNFAGE